MPGESAAEVNRALAEYLASVPAGELVKPGPRVKFRWPPHPPSYAFQVHASDWSGNTRAVIRGEEFEVRVARTTHGVFGRCESLWVEGHGADEASMLKNLAKEAEPLFQRQLAIASVLGLASRFTGHIRDLPPSSLVKLLYCRDRDVASEAQTEIETHASSHVFFEALLSILLDRRHPFRRSAQWCVLDLFEDLASFTDGPDDESRALEAIKSLIWDATDDYARTIFKAGVVLGGHLAHEQGGRILIQCLQAPSKIGRRSAIHGLFHTVEWFPNLRSEVLAGLRQVAASDPESLLRDFASEMADDIEQDNYDHVLEPTFSDEP